MTEADMKAQLQAAQDMLDVIQEQRNANANQIVQLGGQLKAAQRRISELEAQIASVAADNKTDTPSQPHANGHDAEAVA